jgi:hypothetical protein
MNWFSAIKLAIPLGLLLGLLWFRHEAQMWHKAADAYAVANAANEASYRAAVATMEARAIANKIKVEAKQEQDRKNAQVGFERLLADNRRLAFKRLRTPPPAISSNSGTGSDMPSPAFDPGLSENPSPDAVVAISVADFDICTDAATYAMSVYEAANRE